MKKVLIVSLILGIITWVSARTFVIVADPETIQIESRTITTFRITKTTIATAPDDPNSINLIIRLTVQEL